MSKTTPQSNILVIEQLQDLRRFVAERRVSGKKIGLVPTMGALHAGHLSLVEHSQNECDVSIVSIYVNPKQFAAGEDLSKYPKNLDRDLSLLADYEVAAVFCPTDQIMYPPEFSTLVQPPAVAKPLEGEFRPDHFRGVTTVVLKLVNMVSPDVAFFGQKDFQQVLVIRQMLADLNVPVHVVTCPIVRDPDGLALSSRNTYLDAEQRERALALSRCLAQVRTRINEGETDSHTLMAEMKQWLIDGGVSDIDYAVIANPHDLKTQQTLNRPAVVLIAAYVESTRLIDNCLIE